MKVGIGKFVKLMVVTVVVAFVTSSVMAKDVNEPNKAQHKMHQPRVAKDPVDVRLDQLTKSLNLTKDQQATIKPVLTEEISQREAVSKDKSLAPAQRREKMQEITKATNDKIEAALTAEQKEKFKNRGEAMKERRERHKAPKTPADGNSPAK